MGGEGTSPSTCTDTMPNDMASGRAALGTDHNPTALTGAWMLNRASSPMAKRVKNSGTDCTKAKVQATMRPPVSAPRANSVDWLCQDYFKTMVPRLVKITTSACGEQSYLSPQPCSTA